MALFEAIHGERPFAGRTLDEIADAIVHGRVTAPPAGARIPAALQAALLRGLSVRPADWHASMDALLGELTSAGEVAASDPLRRRRGVVIGVVTGLTAGAVALTAVLLARAGSERAAAPPPAARPASQAPAPTLRPTATPVVEPAPDVADPPPPEETATPPAAETAPAATAERTTPAAADTTPETTPPLEQTRKASARRPRSQRATRRVDGAGDQAPEHPKVRVGDGLRDPFGGGGDR